MQWVQLKIYSKKYNIIVGKSSEQKYNRLGHLEINGTQNPFFAAILNLTLTHDDCLSNVQQQKINRHFLQTSNRKKCEE